jgi:hypothetical protein
LIRTLRWAGAPSRSLIDDAALGWSASPDHSSDDAGRMVAN